MAKSVLEAETPDLDLVAGSLCKRVPPSQLVASKVYLKGKGGKELHLQAER